MEIEVGTMEGRSFKPMTFITLKHRPIVGDLVLVDGEYHAITQVIHLQDGLRAVVRKMLNFPAETPGT